MISSLNTWKKNDICYNLDQWEPNSHNILFVTGISGSGKTALGVDLSKEFKCHRIELDYISLYYLRKNIEKGNQHNTYELLQKDCPEAVEFFDKYPVDVIGMKEKFADTLDILEKFCVWFISKYEGSKNLYIINGAVIPVIYPPDYFKERPLILKDINLVKTIMRRVCREFTGNDDPILTKISIAYKAFKTGMSRMYRDANKDFQKFKKGLDTFANITESVIINETDFEQNVSQFGKTYNIIFITGLSGSGKSTKAGELAKKFHAAHIELDLLEHNAIVFNEKHPDKGNQLIKEYLTKNYGGQRKFSPDDPAYGKAVEGFLKYAIAYAKAHKNENFVIEGIQLLFMPESILGIIKQYPCIIKGTSVIQSMGRAAKREDEGQGMLEYFKSFNSWDAIKEYISWYKSDEKGRKKFKKFMKESEELPMTPEELLEAYDAIIEAVESFEDTEEEFTEGANLDIRAKYKEAKKEYKKICKTVRKLAKEKKYKEAEREAKKLLPIIKQARKDCESIDTTVGSSILGFFTAWTLSFFRDLALCFIPFVGLTVAAVWDAVESWGIPVRNVLKFGYLDPQDLNAYKNTAISKLKYLEMVAKKLPEKIKEAEKNEAKAVKESVEDIVNEKRLAIYEACQEGKITMEEREELLERLSDAMVVAESIQAVGGGLSPIEKFDRVKLDLYERCTKGEITVDEREAMIDEAADNILGGSNNGGNNDSAMKDMDKQKDNAQKEIEKASQDMSKNIDDAVKDAQSAVDQK